MSQPLLAFNEVDVFYGPIQALKQVSLTVNEGETVALIGANGAGKSTLLMSVFGQPRIAGGRFSIAGRRSAGSRPTLSPATASPRPRKGGASFPI
ncbi:lsa(C)_1_HM990671 [Klebsiella pneumoniae]|nr:lsa(C)_1_HM990671 [Klebsiella pneumoniae]